MLVSVITDKKNCLVKVINEDLSQTSPQHLYDGTITTKNLSASELADLIPSLSQHSCLCLGIPEDLELDSPKTIKVNPDESKGEISRSKKYLSWPMGVPSWVLFDFDNSGLAPEEGRLQLVGIDPRIKNAPYVVCPSSSSYIYDGDKCLKGEGNFHIYIAMEIEEEEYFDDFFNRSLLSGACYPFVTKAGSVVIRSSTDRSVFSPEREIFSADPIFSKDSMCTRRNDFITYGNEEGTPVIADSTLRLDGSQQLELRILLQEKRGEVSGEVAEKRKEYLTVRARRKAKLNGTTTQEELDVISRKNVDVYDRNGRPIYELLSSEVIYNNDSELMRVSDILEAPQDWDGKKLPDPYEPWTRGSESRNEVGRGVATALVRDDGSVFIYSHAHCGQMYMLRWSAVHLIDIILDPSVTVQTKQGIWRRLTSGVQEFSLTASDSDIAEVADAFKQQLSAIPKSGVAGDKRKVEAKLKKTAKPKDCKEAEDPVLTKFNSKYGMCMMGGKVAIIHEKFNKDVGTFEPEGLKPFDMKVFYANDRMINFDLRGNPIEMNTYQVWEQHEERNTFDSVVFRPHRNLIRAPGDLGVIQQGGCYNMWQGYIADMSKATSCEKILWHLKHIWCGGDERYYNYVIGWIAELFQNPADKCGTTLVLRSGQGTGKNIIIDNVLVSLLGTHAISTSNKDDFVGKFNKQLAWNILLFANEAFWAGDKGDKSQLKTLVTDSERTIEQKGFDKVKARSYTKLIFAGNEQWILNIDLDDRRNIYLPMSSEKVGDSKYFEELMSEIENGGKESFLDYMLNVFEPKMLMKENQPDRLSILKIDDILQSAPPEVKFIHSIIGEDPMYEIYELDEHLAALMEKLIAWRYEDSGEVLLRRGDLHALFSKFCLECQISRKHITMQSMAATLTHWGMLGKRSCLPEELRDKLLLSDVRRSLSPKAPPTKVLSLKPWRECQNWIQDAHDIKKAGMVD